MIKTSDMDKSLKTKLIDASLSNDFISNYLISVMRKNTQKKLRVLVLKTLVQMLILAVSLRNKSSE